MPTCKDHLQRICQRERKGISMGNGCQDVGWSSFGRQVVPSCSFCSGWFLLRSKSDSNGIFQVAVAMVFWHQSNGVVIVSTRSQRYSPISSSYPWPTSYLKFRIEIFRINDLQRTVFSDWTRSVKRCNHGSFVCNRHQSQNVLQPNPSFRFHFQLHQAAFVVVHGIQVWRCRLPEKWDHLQCSHQCCGEGPGLVKVCNNFDTKQNWMYYSQFSSQTYHPLSWASFLTPKWFYAGMAGCLGIAGGLAETTLQRWWKWWQWAREGVFWSKTSRFPIIYSG